MLKPATLLLTRSKGWGSTLIRLGAALRDEPNLVNHVAVFHHYDAAGIPWAIEGRPGGVGWVDARKYLRSRWTVVSTQPINDNAREAIAHRMTTLLGTAYDWQAIAADAFASLRIPTLFAQDWHGQGSPGHVVCSSYAAFEWMRQGLDRPRLGHERFCTPNDWQEFLITEGWAGSTAGRY